MNIPTLFAALLTALPAVAQTTLFQDNFPTPGTKLDLTKWTTEIGCGSFLGRTQLADWVTPGGVGQFIVGGSGAQLALNTFNPTGSSFYGTHGKSLLSFQPTASTTIEFKTRMQLTSLQPGIVYGMYFFRIPVPCTTLHDEIDIELVTNMLQPGGTPMIQLNRYANEPLGPGNGVTVNAPAGFNALAPHDYTIRWSLAKIDYLVDGTLLYSTTTHVPQGPMQVNVNAWGTATDWPAAYDASLQIANNAGQNQRFFALVNSVTVTSSSGSEIGYVDLAGDSNGVPTVVKGAALSVQGWAADTVGGAPVQNVTIFLDGSPVGTATLGGLRPDVVQVLARNDCLTSGWNFVMTTSNLSLGQHSITATATGISGTSSLTGTKIVNIVQSGGGGGGGTIGFVDFAGNASGLASVVKGATLFVNGWAADSALGAPILGVTVFIDGFSVGAATLGTARPDVAQSLGSANFLNSGWIFQMSTSNLSAGSHFVTAIGNGPSGAAQLVGAKNVTITTVGQEIGFVDFAGAANGSLTLVQGGTLLAQGWAADTASGAPVQAVTVFIDGVAAGTATLGISRPDVAAFYNRIDYSNSGWTFQMSTSGLSVGTHTLTASATGLSGTVALAGNKTFQITGAQASQVIGYVDIASVQGNTITIQGWAADSATGAPVQSVSVLVDGTFTLAASLGISRPDVATAFGRPDFTNSGWIAFVNFPQAVGSHTFTASATGTSGSAPLVGVKIATFP